MADFKIYSSKADLETKTLAKASATVLEDGDMCTLTAGLAVKAVAASAKIAFVLGGGEAGSLEVTVLASPEVVYQGTADAAFAATDRGIECDLVGTTTQLIDLGASATDVLKIEPGSNAAVVGATADVLFTINKPL